MSQFPPPKIPWSFHIITLGCKVNQYESQAIREAWYTCGGVEVADPAMADVALVNSCAVTAKGEREGRNALYRLHRAKSDALRILTGCAANLIAKSLPTTAKNSPHAYFHVCVPPRAKAILLQGPWQWQHNKLPHILPEKQVFSPFGNKGFCIRASQKARPVVKVQDGCSHRCTYCIVPLMRGPSVSRAATDILAEIHSLLEAGHSEIMLSGINLHQYGRNTSAHTPTQTSIPQNFWHLLRFLDTNLAPQWLGKARLRLSSLEPTQLTEEGIHTLCTARLLCPHMHISLQHGSERVLKNMGRGHCRLEILQEALTQIRSHWQSNLTYEKKTHEQTLLGIGADILMGFPGEEEEDVQKTLMLIKTLGLTYAHVFPYSQRPGTPATTFAGQVPHALTLERTARVRAQVSTQKNTFLQQLCHKKYVNIVPNYMHTAAQNTVAISTPEVQQTYDMGTMGIWNDMGKGIDAHYAPCRILVPMGQKLPQGIIAARPVHIEKETLITLFENNL